MLHHMLSESFLHEFFVFELLHFIQCFVWVTLGKVKAKSKVEKNEYR